MPKGIGFHAVELMMIEAISQGGLTWTHRIRMLRQALRFSTYASLFVGVIAFAAFMISMHPGMYQAVWYYAKANTLQAFADEIFVDQDFWAHISNKIYYGKSELLLETKTVIEYTQPYVYIFLERVKVFLIASLKIAGIINLTILLFFLARGIIFRRKKHISGRNISSPIWLALRLSLKRMASPIKIGRVPLVKGKETQHILVSGGTGSGKTNCFHHILPQVRALGQKAVIVDTTGAFVERYYRPGKDILLNPFDHRGVDWHPWAECVNKFDYEALTESIIPESQSQNEGYWRTSARALFSALLQKFSLTKKTSDIVQWLTFEPLPNLCKFLQGTKAAAHMDMSSEKTASSIRSVANSFLDCLENLKDTDTPFSIKDWIENEDTDSWLFLYSSPLQRTTLNPLLSCWFSLAIRSLMGLQPNQNRRLWFVVDELASLNRLKDLEKFLAEGRKFGGCGLFALQSPAQLNEIYGQNITQTIIGNCGTKIIFSEHDPQIATLISKYFGEKEIREYHKSLSYGSQGVRDGESLSIQTRKVPVVPPSDIQSLVANEAYMILPGNFPITKQRLAIVR